MMFYAANELIFKKKSKKNLIKFKSVINYMHYFLQTLKKVKK